jgi:hypothetical protein
MELIGNFYAPVPIELEAKKACTFWRRKKSLALAGI